MTPPTTERERQWRQSLKAGDEVLVWSHRYLHCEPELMKVTKANKVRILAGDLFTFSPKDGYGRKYTSGWITEPSQEALADAAELTEYARSKRLRNETMNRLRSVGWETLTTEQLARVAAILDEAKIPNPI